MFAMGELSGQVSALRQELAYQREERDRESAELKQRLDRLEKWRYKTMGVAATITVLINAIALLWEHYGR